MFLPKLSLCIFRTCRPMYTDEQCSNCPKGGGGGRNFSLSGGLRDEVEGSNNFLDTGLNKRWGSNFIINYRRKR